MLGRTLPSGSDAISFHNTLFRVSELCWIKAVRLTPLEWGIKIASLVLAVVWVFAMKSAKGTAWNVEFLLALFPLVLAWNTAGSLRIGCSGDFEESYEERRGARSELFRGWIEALQRKEPDWLHLQSPHYDVLLNPHRLAWIRPCFQWHLYPLVVIGTFLVYLYLLGLNLPLNEVPVVDDFRILLFEEGAKSRIRLLSYLVVTVSALAFIASIKRSVEICGTGGVQDTFAVSAADQGRLVDAVLGKTAAPARPQPSPSGKANAKSNTSLEVKVSKPEPPSAEPSQAAAPTPEAAPPADRSTPPS